MKLSKKINSISESGTVKFTPIINKLQEQNKEIISLAIGELDFETPNEIKKITIDAINNNKTNYCPVSGLLELKKKIINKLKRKNNLDYDIENLIITNGSKQSLYNIFQVICNPGDEIIINKPFWGTYEEQIKCADASPIFVDTVNHQLNLKEITKAITKKTKAIVINSPNNPTGAIYSKEDLTKIGELAIKHDFFIISDEAYETIIYDDLKHQSIASFSDEIKKRTISVFSFSKSYSMTGFRIGYTVAVKEIINSMNRLQGHSTGNVCTFAQYGAIKALDIDNKITNEWIPILQRRRDLAYFLTTKYFECIKPQGAFYLFAKIDRLINKNIPNATVLVNELIKKANVICIPGEVFGMKNHIRIAYPLEEKRIKDAFERIGKVLN